MPKLKEYIKSLEADNARLVEENRDLAHDRYLAERHYDAEKANNDFLKKEIEEWKKMASHLMEQLVKRTAEHACAEEELAKLSTPMPF